MNKFRVQLSLSTALLGFVCSHASAATVHSQPYGVLSTEISTGVAGLTFPLIKGQAFAGKVVGNSTSELTFEGAVNVGAALEAGQPYYAEVLSGAFEGERIGVNTTATRSAASTRVVLDFGSALHSTTGSLSVNQLAGAEVAIRPHLTLAKLATTFTPALKGNNLLLRADLVSVVGPREMAVYQLRGDNKTWRQVGKSADVRNLVIPPDVGVLVRLASGSKQWVQEGQVRTNAFRKNLVRGQQGFATGFPVNMSPADIGAVVDAEQSAATRWVGSNNPLAADRIAVFDPSRNDYASYYLRADGVTWRPLFGGSSVTMSDILKTTGLIVVTRKNSDPDYLIVPPFAD